MNTEGLKQLLNKWSEEGMRLPFARDVAGKRPSVTLLFFYISYIIGQGLVTYASVLLIKNGNLISGMLMPVTMVVLTYVFYRFRYLTKVSFDLDDKKLEIEGSSRGARRSREKADSTAPEQNLGETNGIDK